MNKGLTLKIIAIILISGVGIAFAGRIEGRKDKLYAYCRAKGVVIYNGPYQKVEKFTDYNIKETRNMKQIDMGRYKAYVLANAQVRISNDIGNYYLDKVENKWFDLQKKQEPDYFIEDISSEHKEKIKKKYKIDSDNKYQNMLLYFTIVSSDARNEDEFAEELFDQYTDDIYEKRVLQFDNGIIKGFIRVNNIRKGAYFIDVFSKDEKKYARVVVKADYDTMCRVVNSFEFK